MGNATDLLTQAAEIREAGGMATVWEVKLKDGQSALVLADRMTFDRPHGPVPTSITFHQGAEIVLHVRVESLQWFRSLGANPETRAKITVP